MCLFPFSKFDAYVSCMQPAHICPRLLEDFVKNTGIYTSEPYSCHMNATLPDINRPDTDTYDEQEYTNSNGYRSTCSFIITVLFMLLNCG